MDGVNILKEKTFNKYIPIQMTQYQENTTAPDSDHQHNRKEIQNFYIKLPKGDIIPEYFF